MTSLKSSRETFAFTLRKSLKLIWIFPIVSTLLNIFAYNGIFRQISTYKYFMKLGQVEDALELKDEYVFLITKYIDSRAVFVNVVFIALAAFMALLLFGFMLGKRASNVWLSLGVSRSNLFSAKFTAAFITLLLGSAVPFALITVCNIWFFGFSKALIITVLHTVLKMFTIQLYAFSVMTLAVTMVGSYLESCIMGGVAIISPIIISDSIAMLMSAVVYGSPYTYDGIFGGSPGVFDSSGRLIDTSFKIIHSDRYFLPTSDLTGFLNKGSDFTAPPFKWNLFFLAVVILIAFAAMKSFSKRRAEKAGFMGMSPLLEGYCVVTVGTELAMFVNSVFGRYITVNSCRLLILIAGVIIMAVGYTVVDLVCVRSFKTYFKRIRHLGAEIGIFLVTVLFFSVGMSMRYSSVPSVSEIESAAVSLEGMTEPYQTDLLIGDDSFARLDLLLADHSGTKYIIEGFDKKEDIERIVSLNETLKNNKSIPQNDQALFITYKLKNGKTVKRGYKAYEGTMYVMTKELYMSENYRDFILNIGKDDYLWTMPVIANRDFSNVKSVHKDETLFKELLSAVLKDLKEGNIEAAFRQDESTLGYIIFDAGSLEYDEYGYPLFSDKDVDVTDEMFICGRLCFEITDSAENTLAFMEQNGLLDYLTPGVKEPVRIALCKYEKSGNDEYDESVYTGRYTGKYFGVSTTPESEYTYYDEYYDEFGNKMVIGTVIDPRQWYSRDIMPSDSKVITDKSQMAVITGNFQIKSDVSQDIYFAQIEYPDGTFVYGFVPSQVVDSLK